MAVSVKDLDCHAIIFISYSCFSFPRSAYEIRHALARAESHATTLFGLLEVICLRAHGEIANKPIFISINAD